MSVVPYAWLSQVSMQRVIVHWTAGAHNPSPEDRAHYHLLVDGAGRVHAGDKPIAANVSTKDGYVAHTRGANTGSIGLAACGMRGALRLPFWAGPAPITRPQWNVLLLAAADLCRFYRIPPDETHLLMHCEVGKFLKRPQLGKWDVRKLPFDRGEWAKVTPGEELRSRVARLLSMPAGTLGTVR